MLPDERLVDAEEAARLLGVKKATIYQWAYRRRIPVVKLFDRALRLRLSTVRRLMAERPARKNT
jgi:excisionase family DNA binding protein